MGTASAAGAIELRSATLNAWQDYARDARVRMESRLEAKESFLWIDESADRAQRVRRGETVVAPLLDNGVHPVPHGAIHHWIGAVFLPGATMASFLAVVDDYDRYSEIYKPVVAASKSHAAKGNKRAFSMIWQRRVLFVHAAIQAWFQAHEGMVDACRGYTVVDATRVQQIQHFRQASERLLPPDTGDGFMWRIQSIIRFEQRDGGVYLEIEAMTLTRDIPASLQWLVAPVVKRLSVNSLVTTLEKTRNAVSAQKVAVAMRVRQGQE
ncbi:MAG: hypothetical protein JNN08_01510 [Bryobacterales bacterium]|nr:hypothetical protein [Bryobacterales bacterium]